jgi:hypothetical protein
LWANVRALMGIFSQTVGQVSQFGPTLYTLRLHTLRMVCADNHTSAARPTRVHASRADRWGDVASQPNARHQRAAQYARRESPCTPRVGCAHVHSKVAPSHLWYGSWKRHGRSEAFTSMWLRCGGTRWGRAAPLAPGVEPDRSEDSSCGDRCEDGRRHVLRDPRDAPHFFGALAGLA